MFTDLLGRGNRVVGKISIIGLGHLQGPLKRLLDLGLKPMFNAARDKPHCHKKEEDRWNEGKADKGHHQFGPQLCSQDLPLSLKDQFDQISDHQKDQEEDQDDVDIDQAEDDDVVGDGDLPSHLGEFHLDGGEDDDQNGDDPDDQKLIASSSRFWRKFLFHHYLISLVSLFNSPPFPYLAMDGGTPLKGRGGFLRWKGFDMPIGFEIPQGDEKEEILQMQGESDRIQLSLDAEVRWKSQV